MYLIYSPKLNLFYFFIKHFLLLLLFSFFFFSLKRNVSINSTRICFVFVALYICSRECSVFYSFALLGLVERHDRFVLFRVSNDDAITSLTEQSHIWPVAVTQSWTRLKPPGRWGQQRCPRTVRALRWYVCNFQTTRH